MLAISQVATNYFVLVAYIIKWTEQESCYISLIMFIFSFCSWHL